MAGPAEGGLGSARVPVHVLSSLRRFPSRRIQEPLIPERWYTLPSRPPRTAPAAGARERCLPSHRVHTAFIASTAVCPAHSSSDCW